MLYCIVLYCIVLYCIVLYCIVLYCIVVHCTNPEVETWSLLRDTTLRRTPHSSAPRLSGCFYLAAAFLVGRSQSSATQGSCDSSIERSGPKRPHQQKDPTITHYEIISGFLLGRLEPECRILMLMLSLGLLEQATRSGRSQRSRNGGGPARA